MLNLVDDTPIVPGDTHPAFGGTEASRQVLNDAEDELRNWQANLEPIQSYAGSLGRGNLPESQTSGIATSTAGTEVSQEAELAQENAAYAETASRRMSASNEESLDAGTVGNRNGGEVQPRNVSTEAERSQAEAVRAV